MKPEISVDRWNINHKITTLKYLINDLRLPYRYGAKIAKISNLELLKYLINDLINDLRLPYRYGAKIQF